MLIKPTNYEELSKLADMILKTDFISANSNKETLMVTILFGMEIGLPPIAAIRNIFMVNKQPVISGDAMLSLIYSSNLVKDYKQYYEAKEDKVIVTVSRKDNNITITSEFSMEDARKANLLDKPIWKQYPKRMLLYRARSYALRDCFPDILKGLRSQEEMEDSIITTVAEDNNTIIPNSILPVTNSILPHTGTKGETDEKKKEIKIGEEADKETEIEKNEDIGALSFFKIRNKSENISTNENEDFIEVFDF